MYWTTVQIMSVAFGVGEGGVKVFLCIACSRQKQAAIWVAIRVAIKRKIILSGLDIEIVTKMDQPKGATSGPRRAIYT